MIAWSIAFAVTFGLACGATALAVSFGLRARAEYRMRLMAEDRLQAYIEQTAARQGVPIRGDEEVDDSDAASSDIDADGFVHLSNGRVISPTGRVLSQEEYLAHEEEARKLMPSG